MEACTTKARLALLEFVVEGDEGYVETVSLQRS